MTGAFQGFPRELPEFLWGIALNNEKPWFEARRDIYERCLHGPMRALALGLVEALGEKYPDLTFTPHVSRIYRDARTLNGRGPLNDHMWFSIGRTGRVYAVEPQFYFGIEARCCDWGVGNWNSDAAGMERWRRRIDASPAKLGRIVKKLGAMEDFALLGGAYKRPKGDPGKGLFEWYNARRIVFGKVEWFEPDPPGAELFDALLADYCALMPLYRYLGGDDRSGNSRD